METLFTPSNRFADEEVESCYAYPPDYKVKGITEQIDTLRQLCPALASAEEQPFPADAEGCFAIPRYELVAASYNDAVQKVLQLMYCKGDFYSWREGHLGPQYLRQTDHAVRFWEKLGKKQKGHDILIVPAQFGLRHRGRSVRRARAVMNSSEFGLGAFAVGIMILTHPERLKHDDALWIDCAGDEYSSDAAGQVERTPIFYFSHGKVGFSVNGVSDASALYGSASGFVSQ